MEQQSTIKLKKNSTVPETTVVLSELKTYRPVQFHKQLESFFKHGNPKWPGLTMTFDTKLGIVEILVPDKDSIIIVPANIEYMKRA